MLKKSFVLLSAMLLLTSSIAVSDANLVSAASNPAAQTLTLEQAKDVALQNNIDLKKAKLDYNQAITDASQANYNADQVGDDVSSQSDAKTKYVTPKQAALAKEAAQQTYQIKQDQTQVKVQAAYYTVLEKANIVKLKAAAVDRATAQLDLTQKKFRAGSVIKTDVNQAEMGLASAKADLATAQMDLKSAQVALNQVLGVDVGNEYQLTQELKYDPVTVPTVEELTKQALANRLDIKQAQNAVTIAQMNYDLVVGYQAPNTWSARQNKTTLDKAQLDLQQTEQGAKAEVIATIFKVQKDEEVVQLDQGKLDQAKDNYNLQQRRYAIGVGTAMDVLTASIDLASAEETYTEAVYNYTLDANQLNSVIQ